MGWTLSEVGLGVISGGGRGAGDAEGTNLWAVLRRSGSLALKEDCLG